MADIVSISEYRERRALRTGYRLWCRFFKDEFHIKTRLQDLSPEVLCRLSEPGRSSDLLFYSLILGFLDYSADQHFESLDKRMQMHVVDVHLFLTDQMRFEMMRRIGWLVHFGAAPYPLYELVRNFNRVTLRCRQDPPILAPTHPQFKEYISLVDPDKQVFIRRLFLNALEVFKRTYCL